MPDPESASFTVPAQAEPRSSRRWLFALWPPLWSVISGTVVFLLSWPAGLVEDDILNLQLHRGVDNLSDLLFTPVFLTQVAPGHQALTALQLEVGPTDRVVMHALMAVAAGSCVWLASSIVAHLTRPSLWVPVVFALVLAGPASLPVALWYAAAYHFYPALLFGLVGILLYARWRGGGDELPSGLPLLSVLAIATGLLFSLKAGAAVVLMLLLEYVLLRRGDLETVLLGLWRDRRVWASYGLLLGVYLALTQRGGLSPEVGDASTIAVALLRGVVQLSAPMLVGVGATEPNYTVPDVPATLAVGAWVAVVVIMILIARVGDASRRGLIVGGIVLVVTLTLSTAPRTTFLGDFAALAPRYHLDGLTYLVLAVAVGLHRDGFRAGAGASSTTGARTRRALGVLALAGVAVTTGWSHSTRLDSSAAIESGAWTATLEASIAEQSVPPRVLEAPMPPFMLSLVPGSRVSYLDGLVDGLDVTLRSPDSVATASGTIERLRTEELFSQSGGEFVLNPLVDATGEFTIFGETVCTPTEFRLAVPLAPHPAPRLLGLQTDGAMTVTVGYPPRDVFRAEPAIVTSDDEEGELVLPMDLLGRARAIELTIRADEEATACLSGVRYLEVRNDLPGEFRDEG